MVWRPITWLKLSVRIRCRHVRDSSGQSLVPMPPHPWKRQICGNQVQRVRALEEVLNREAADASADAVSACREQVHVEALGRPVVTSLVVRGEIVVVQSAVAGLAAGRLDLAESPGKAIRPVRRSARHR